METPTNEEKYNISKQPKEQCPLIDNVISELKDNASNISYSYKNLLNIPEAEAEDYISDLDWADYNLRNLEDNMEEIRGNIVKIRNWGQEWKDFALTLIEEKENINEYLENFK